MKYLEYVFFVSSFRVCRTYSYSTGMWQSCVKSQTSRSEQTRATIEGPRQGTRSNVKRGLGHSTFRRPNLDLSMIRIE